MRIGTVALATMLLASCSQANDATSSPAGATEAAEGAVATLSASAAAGPEATPSPTDSQSAADVEVVGETVIAWPDPYGSEMIMVQVIVEVQNGGDAWVRSTGRSTFQVYGTDGSPTLVGGVEPSFFDREVPFLGPGEVGYLLLEGFEEAGDVSDFDRVEVIDLAFEMTAPPPEGSFEFSDVALTPLPDTGETVATGSVVFTGTEPPFLTLGSESFDISVTVVCVGAGDQLLGATTGYVYGLVAGQPAEFQTQEVTPPLDPGQCVELRTVAGYPYG